jgi:hypothetical protein
MSRKAPDPSARIALLKAARANLVKLKIKGPLNGDEMAKACGVTWRTLKPMLEADPKWPCLMRGSEGVAYQIEPRSFIDYWIKKLEAQLAERRSKAEKIALIAGFAPEVAATGLSLEELRQLDAMQINAQRRKIEQGTYIPLAKFESIIVDILTTMQTETLATVSRMDPAGKWPPEVRAGVAEAMKSLLVRLHDKLGAKFDPDVQSDSAPRKRVRTPRK